MFAAMNWRRGLFRMWLVVSLGWTGTLLFFHGPRYVDCYFINRFSHWNGWSSPGAHCAYWQDQIISFNLLDLQTTMAYATTSEATVRLLTTARKLSYFMFPLEMVSVPLLLLFCRFVAVWIAKGFR